MKWSKSQNQNQARRGQAEPGPGSDHRCPINKTDAVQQLGLAPETTSGGAIDQTDGQSFLSFHDGLSGRLRPINKDRRGSINKIDVPEQEPELEPEPEPKPESGLMQGSGPEPVGG